MGANSSKHYKQGRIEPIPENFNLISETSKIELNSRPSTVDASTSTTLENDQDFSLQDELNTTLEKKALSINVDSNAEHNDDTENMAMTCFIQVIRTLKWNISFSVECSIRKDVGKCQFTHYGTRTAIRNDTAMGKSFSNRS